MTLLTVRAAFVLDDAAALGPQLVAARAEPEPVSWKLLAQATGYSVRWLQNTHAETLAELRYAAAREILQLGRERALRANAHDKRRACAR